jgi:hypothetical protein
MFPHAPQSSPENKHRTLHRWTQPQGSDSGTAGGGRGRRRRRAMEGVSRAGGDEAGAEFMGAAPDGSDWEGRWAGVEVNDYPSFCLTLPDLLPLLYSIYSYSLSRSART